MEPVWLEGCAPDPVRDSALMPEGGFEVVAVELGLAPAPTASLEPLPRRGALPPALPEGRDVRLPEPSTESRASLPPPSLPAEAAAAPETDACLLAGADESLCVPQLRPTPLP